MHAREERMPGPQKNTKIMDYERTKLLSGLAETKKSIGEQFQASFLWWKSSLKIHKNIISNMGFCKTRWTMYNKLIVRQQKNLYFFKIQALKGHSTFEKKLKRGAFLPVLLPKIITNLPPTPKKKVPLAPNWAYLNYLGAVGSLYPPSPQQLYLTFPCLLTIEDWR